MNDETLVYILLFALLIFGAVITLLLYWLLKIIADNNFEPQGKREESS